jgi:hypothetical protein
MQEARRRLGFALTGLGLLGVASLALLPVEQLVPGPLPVSVAMLRLLSLINPALLVVGAAWIGTVLAHRIGLDAPAIRQALAGSSSSPAFRRQVTKAVWAGLGIGLLLAGYAVASGPYFATLDPDAASRLQALTPPFAVRILYGGIAEEIIARWGVMTLVCWMTWRLMGRPLRPPGTVFWIGIVAAALIFGLAHLPFLFGVAGDPPIWLPVVAVGTNVVAGVVFGWLFWRAGLEAAILAHAFAHVTAVMVGAVAGT